MRARLRVHVHVHVYMFVHVCIFVYVCVSTIYIYAYPRALEVLRVRTCVARRGYVRVVGWQPAMLPARVRVEEDRLASLLCSMF